jgi:ABC-type nitrate/sulfonate/bicarbonate transport system substrate-binding protein
MMLPAMLLRLSLRPLALVGLTAIASACGAGSTAPAPSSAPRAASAPASDKPAGSASAQASDTMTGGDPNGSPVRVSYPSPAVSELPYYAAISQGLFQQQHIKLTELMMPPNVSITALSKGEIDFTDSPGNAIEGATRGLPFKVVFSAWQKSPWNLVGKTQYNSIADLKGKVIGTNQAGSTPYIYLQAGLKKAGLQMSDAKIVSSSGTVITYQNLIAGQLDAAVLSPPFDAQSELGGFHQIQFLGDVLDLPYIGAATTTAYLSAHHDETVRFLRALIQGNRWIKDHPSETADLIVKYTGAPPDAARKSAEQMIPNLWQDNFEASPNGLQQSLDYQAEATKTKIDMKPDQLIDYGPLHEALKA